ncbi:hypothetical protein PV11_04965 [Exophiala sideris]|uniref:Uncharacterized protein n=1 Tax=Exophiala sideris TaxID=1016849 RepID=A0A0D1YNY2_9EURO|nr:hypothetical protein PV11_04965 [Exophiala sideris]
MSLSCTGDCRARTPSRTRICSVDIKQAQIAFCQIRRAPTHLWGAFCMTAVHPKSYTPYEYAWFVTLQQTCAPSFQYSTVPWWKPLTSFCLGPSASCLHRTSICRLTILGTCRACFNISFTTEVRTILMGTVCRVYKCVLQST